jgi:uncharacterized membrane protein YebE (DUF533 family)
MTDRNSSSNIVSLPQKSSRSDRPSVTDFVREHPLLVVAGGIAIGAVAAALLPRGTARKLAKNAVHLAEVAGTAGALLGTRVRDTAETAGAGLREQGGAVAERLEKLGGVAAERFEKVSDAAGSRLEHLLDPVDGVAAKVAKKASDLRSRIRH